MLGKFERGRHLNSRTTYLSRNSRYLTKLSMSDQNGSPPISETKVYGENRNFPDVALGEANSYGHTETQRLIRKIDLHIIPLLAILYLYVQSYSKLAFNDFCGSKIIADVLHSFSFLDRTNIGNARLAYLEETLNINPKSLGYNV